MCEKSIVVGEQTYFSETHAEVVQGELPRCLYEMDQKKRKIMQIIVYAVGFFFKKKNLF